MQGGRDLLVAHEARHRGVTVADRHDSGGFGGYEGWAGQGQAPQLPGTHGSDEHGVRTQRPVHLVCLCVQEVQPVRHLAQTQK